MVNHYNLRSNMHVSFEKYSQDIYIDGLLYMFFFWLSAVGQCWTGKDFVKDFDGGADEQGKR